jgi:hypothetical protein
VRAITGPGDYVDLAYADDEPLCSASYAFPQILALAVDLSEQGIELTREHAEARFEAMRSFLICGPVRLPVPLEVDGGRRDAGRLTGVCR